MITAAARLIALSGLAGVSAAHHLVAISQSGVTAAERLLSYSSLPSATAAQHLLDNVVNRPVPIVGLLTIKVNEAVVESVTGNCYANVGVDGPNLAAIDAGSLKIRTKDGSIFAAGAPISVVVQDTRQSTIFVIAE